MGNQYAILLDGGFVTKTLLRRNKSFPTANAIETEYSRIQDHFSDFDLLRIYYYDARPAKDTLTNPIDKSKMELSKTPRFAEYTSLIDSLEMKENVALRLGETITRGWQFGEKALQSIQKNPRQPDPRDLIPNVTQKGVDIRIGLDIARLGLAVKLHTIVVVSGDSDLIPAFKFARREGVRICLDSLGNGHVRRELKAHTDLLL